MKLKLYLLAGAAFAAVISPSSRAQNEHTDARLGVEKPVTNFNLIEIKNFQDETLGRITDLGIDLINGRIVEVLVVCNHSLDVGSKIVAVPPLALFPDAMNQVYRLDVSVEQFKTAAAIDLSNWTDAGRSERVAAAYHLFGQEPYFLEDGQTASKTASRPKVRLGYVERSNRILDMPVGNAQNVQFGTVSSMSLDIPNGRIRTVVILAPGFLKTMSIVPAMALSFNAKRDGLLLDDTKLQYANEPRYVLTEAAYGQTASSQEESYEGPRTSDPLEQGRSYRDVDKTVLINGDIRKAGINVRHVHVGTIDGRVTLRGWVETDGDRQRVGEIAVTDSRLELVDNQIVVGKPVTTN